MNRTLANKTLLAVVAVLVCMTAACPAAPASTSRQASAGGTSAPSRTPAKPSKQAQVATWFGPGFYGRQTACGQTMTPVIVGVASRTLPCGTLVLVNYKTHQLTVPVIDRGPYAHGVTWDLTLGAASALTITETVRVETKIVGQAADNPLLGVPVEVQPTAEEVASGGTAPA